jgi:Flp pilus assembly protein TadB
MPNGETSAEYMLFKEVEKLSTVPVTLYEKACAAAAKVMHIELDQKSAKRLQESIEFAHLHITPGQVASLTLLFAIAVSAPTFILILTKYLGIALGIALPGLDLSLALFAFMTMIPVAYYLYMYPNYLKKRYEMNAGGDMVNAILYMVIYMRNTPSLEGAVDFASRNVSGPLGIELRKLMYDVRIGNYLGIEDALMNYAKRWKNNREFVEAIELLISSLRQPPPRNTTLLDESVRVVLEGNRESAAAYVRKLKMPINVIHAMGLVLPVMGLVLFPIVAIFLSVSIMPLFLMYDIALPLVLFFFISRALENRPATYSKIDISQHPDLPAKGKFFFGKKQVRALPIAALITIIFLVLAIISYSVGVTCKEVDGKNACAEDETKALISIGNNQSVISFSVLGALLVMLGMAMGPAVYFLLLSRGRSALRDAIQKMEIEFKEALFQLGTVLGGGQPIETAMIDATRRMEGLKVRDLFQRAAFNMHRFSMTFEQAFFDSKQGSLTFYPSLLIRSVMRAIIEAGRKGVRNASAAILSVAQYLRGLHATQEQVQENLSDVVSSLRFQAYALSPLISGVVATMAVLILRILQLLGEKTAHLGTAGAGMAGLTPLATGNLSITPFQFIFVVSVFLVESLFLLSFLMSGIEAGEDPIGRGQLTGYCILIGTTTYLFTTILTLFVFAPLASSVVS